AGKTIIYSLNDLIHYYPLVIKLLDKQIGLNDTVAVSLPAGDYLNTELVRQLERRIEDHTGKQAVVLPQGTMAVLDLYDKGLVELKGKALIIDGGFNTVNVILIDLQSLKPLFTRTYANQIGIRNLLSDYFYREVVKRIYGYPLDLQRLKSDFLAGRTDMGFNEYDLEVEKNTALERFTSDMMNKITGELQIYLSNLEDARYDYVVVVGGLSYYVDVQTNKKFVRGDEFSTVKGMMLQAETDAVDFGFGDIKIAKA
ncbi:MAG: hypothetical protein JHC31_06525, partial [Sulfurihydrogenibium sp.]|nr:hypothetical protein [Sulfurihydrogenibium sp.]